MPDTEDIQKLKNYLDILDKRMGDLDTVYQNITDLSYDPDPDDRTDQKYDLIEAEYHALIKHVSQKYGKLQQKPNQTEPHLHKDLI